MRVNLLNSLDVTCIVVTFNSDAVLLSRCLRAIRTALQNSGISGECLVVDCGSRVPPSIEVSGLRIAMIEIGKNVGFGAASNVGVAQARGRYCMLVNPDAMPDIEAISVLVLAASGAPKRSLFGGWLVRQGNVQSDAYRLWRTSLGKRLSQNSSRRFLASVDKKTVVPVEKICGGALFGDTLLLRELGPFDERFFLYGEDADLSIRSRAAGVELMLCPRARFQHTGAASMKEFAPIVERARVDAALRLAAYHDTVGMSYWVRVELLLVTLAGSIKVGSSSVSRRSRLCRIAELWRWGLQRVAEPFDPQL